ncbi:helix-turn-helix domain-containing protein [Pedobacter panaciterrae]|uniref:helix-turn-helix domain-containing protein n=1 Tax=Pedobacter panaciterrae TaxID=363849 RepID=UPI0025922F19|nr:helix-turn-helix domain-containing protein [uncultured Pedobacter sp.]
MTIDLITREDFQQFKQELLEELKNMQLGNGQTAQHKQWLRSADVRRMLDISPGTLQNLRINGQLRFSRMGARMYYKKEDIEKMLLQGLSKA